MATRKQPKKTTSRAKSGAKSTAIALIPEVVERRIYLIRDKKVMLDSDIAELYEVPTKRLNEQVRRNLSRFPEDFMFRLTRKEMANLRSQFATSSWGGRRTPPLAFTEHGVTMLAAVLNSERAVNMSILIVRAFVKLREAIENQKELTRRMERVEDVQMQQASVIEVLAAEIEQMKRLPPAPKRRIGFHTAV